MATRSPSPVFWNPAAKKNEQTMSQMTGLLKAWKAVAKESVFVATATVRLQKAHAPTGSGSTTRPTIVEAKIANAVHAFRGREGVLFWVVLVRAEK